MSKKIAPAAGKITPLHLIVLIAIGACLFITPIYMRKTKFAAEFLWSKGFIINLSVYITLGLYLVRVFFEGRLVVPKAKTLIPLGLLVLSVFLSLHRVINMPKAAESIIQLHGGIIIYLLILLNVNRRRHLDYLAIAATVATTAVVGFGILQYTGVFEIPADQYGEKDPSSFIGLSNFVVEYLLVAAPFAFTLFCLARNWATIALSGISVLLISWYVIISQNRAGWLGFFVAGSVMLLLLYLRRRKQSLQIPWKIVAPTALGLLLLASILMVSTKQGKKYYERLTSYTDFEDATINFRLHTWMSALNMFFDKPVLGQGLAQVEILFPLFQDAKVERLIFRNNTRVVRAHNEYVQVAAEQGLVGILALLFLIVQVFRLLRNSFRKQLAVDAWWYSAFLGSSLTGYFAMMFFCFPLRVPSSSFYFFVALAAMELVAKFPSEKLTKKDPEPEEAPIDTDDLWILEPSGGFASIAFYVCLTLAGMFCFIGGSYFVNFSDNATTADVLYKESKVYNRWGSRDQNHYLTARKLLNQAIEKNPNNEAYYFDRSIANFQVGDMRESLDDLKQSMVFVPNFGMGHMRLGTMYLNLGKYEEAERHLLKAWDTMYSRRHQIDATLADVYSKEDPPRLDEALEKITRAVDAAEKFIGPGLKSRTKKVRNEASKMQTDLHKYLNVKGQILVRMGSLREASAVFSRSLKLNPNDYLPHVNMAAIYNTTGDYEMALKSLQKASKLESQPSPETNFNYARAYCGTGRTELAMGYYSKAIGSNPQLYRQARKDKCLSDLIKVDGEGK